MLRRSIKWQWKIRQKNLWLAKIMVGEIFVTSLTMGVLRKIKKTHPNSRDVECIQMGLIEGNETVLRNRNKREKWIYQVGISYDKNPLYARIYSKTQFAVDSWYCRLNSECLFIMELTCSGRNWFMYSWKSSHGFPSLLSCVFLKLVFQGAFSSFFLFPCIFC